MSNIPEHDSKFIGKSDDRELSWIYFPVPRNAVGVYYVLKGLCEFRGFKISGGLVSSFLEVRTPDVYVQSVVSVESTDLCLEIVNLLLGDEDLGHQSIVSQISHFVAHCVDALLLFDHYSILFN